MVDFERQCCQRPVGLVAVLGGEVFAPEIVVKNGKKSRLFDDVLILKDGGAVVKCKCPVQRWPPYEATNKQNDEQVLHFKLLCGRFSSSGHFGLQKVDLSFQRGQLFV